MEKSAIANCLSLFCFFFQAEDGIRVLVRSRGLGDVYMRQVCVCVCACARVLVPVCLCSSCLCCRVLVLACSWLCAFPELLRASGPSRPHSLSLPDSYTHRTLPTNRDVYTSEAADELNNK